VAGELSEPVARQLEIYERAADLLSRAGEARGEVIARTNLGRLLNDRGDAAGARAQVERALRAARASEDPEASLRASIFEASQLATDGVELGRAHRILRRGEAALFPDGPRGLQLTLLRILAQVSNQLGLHDDAVDQLQRLIEMRQAAGNLAAVPRHRLSLLLSRHGQLELRPTRDGAVQLRVLAEQVRADAHAHRDPGVEARADALLADLWRADDPVRAARHLERCHRVARTLPSATPLIRCLVGTATLRAASDPEGARRALDRATDLALRHGDGWIGYVTGARLRLAWAGRAGAGAAEASLRGLEALERLREAQPDDEARIGVMRRRISVYNWLAGRLLESDPPDLPRAFAVSERMRARVLQDRLQHAAASGPPDEDAPERDRLRREIEGVQRRLLDPAVAGGPRAALLVQLRQLELREDETVARQGPGLASAQTIALPDAQRLLAPDEVVLVYLVDSDRDLLGDAAGGSWLLAIARDRVSVRRLPDRLALEAAVPMFVGMLHARDGGEAAAAVALHRQLVGDAIGPETRRVTVVPDGVLHALPFAALRAAPDDPPLGARLGIATAPSVSLWARWKGLPAPRAGQGALVVASPALPHARATADAVRGGVLAQGLTLGPLAHARREGARSRQAIGRDSRLLAGERASEAALKRTDLGPFALLHFATHAVADEAFPDRSAVVLAAGSEDEDGLLQPREIAALGLEGRAVILSACQTAAGAYVGGEGVLSLARSFFEAGARTVVAGLWRLRDDETERLMRDFYECLARGDTVGEALRAARARAVAEGAPAAAWAGVVVLGDQDFALPPAPFAWWRVAAVLLPLTVAGTALWLAWRRRG
jgi:tetratricopeptide (TPR) repeat protein